MNKAALNAKVTEISELIKHAGNLAISPNGQKWTETHLAIWQELNGKVSEKLGFAKLTSPQLKALEAGVKNLQQAEAKSATPNFGDRAAHSIILQLIYDEQAERFSIQSNKLGFLDSKLGEINGLRIHARNLARVVIKDPVAVSAIQSELNSKVGEILQLGSMDEKELAAFRKDIDKAIEKLRSSGSAAQVASKKLNYGRALIAVDQELKTRSPENPGKNMLYDLIETIQKAGRAALGYLAEATQSAEATGKGVNKDIPAHAVAK